MSDKPTGRPTAYKPEYDEQAYKLCLLGATDAKMADFFNVTEQTVNNWKNDFPSFFESLKNGKANADAAVAASLYGRALGSSHPEERIVTSSQGSETVEVTKYHPPDTTACIFWLKNRAPEQWRDKQEIESSCNVTVEITRFADKPTE